jgi:hypothetical protein
MPENAENASIAGNRRISIPINTHPRDREIRCAHGSICERSRAAIDRPNEQEHACPEIVCHVGNSQPILPQRSQPAGPAALVSNPQYHIAQMCTDQLQTSDGCERLMAATADPAVGDSYPGTACTTRWYGAAAPLERLL